VTEQHAICDFFFLEKQYLGLQYYCLFETRFSHIPISLHLVHITTRLATQVS